VCVRMCTVSLVGKVTALRQPSASQEDGRSPVCVRMCTPRAP